MAGGRSRSATRAPGCTGEGGGTHLEVSPLRTKRTNIRSRTGLPTWRGVCRDLPLREGFGAHVGRLPFARHLGPNGGAGPREARTHLIPRLTSDPGPLAPPRGHSARPQFDGAQEAGAGRGPGPCASADTRPGRPRAAGPRPRGAREGPGPTQRGVCRSPAGAAGPGATVPPNPSLPWMEARAGLSEDIQATSGLLARACRGV